MDNVVFQYELRPELPNVYGTKDYREFRESLIKIDKILTSTDLEHHLVSQALDQFSADDNGDPPKFYASKQAPFQYRKLRHALCCNIARHLTGESYRLFSIKLADSILFQWFTDISAVGCRKVISKSFLERYEKSFDQSLISEKICQWLASFSAEAQSNKVGLNQTIDFTAVFTDSTCVKENIHFPVDWVLLRDAARSLLLAIKTIRAHGLKHRIIEPFLLLKQMNKLCISMTHARRKKDSKKQRKNILRVMKKLSYRIEKHGKRYRELVQNEWKKTDWSHAQMEQVVRRMDNILDQLPAAVKQAHTRIISEEKVASSEKILSLYDRDAHVIVRGKAGNEVEFGQKLLLSEQKNGIITQWKLFSTQPPADSQLIEPLLGKIKKYFGTLRSVCADRAFDNEKNTDLLKENNTINGICPKSPRKLQEKLKEPHFIKLQTRRSQTEARIGIFKNVFLGKPLRSRITTYKRHAINWCVLAHNLWVIARMAIADERLLAEQAA